MKIWKLYFLTSALLGGLVAGLLAISPSPESLLMGRWKEVSWEYEMKGSGPEVRERLGKTLLLHQTEFWEFTPGNKLTLFRKGKSDTVHWRMAGRSNALALTHAAGVTEHYNITRLTPDRLELNFETDIQARGIAKLTFERMASP